MSVDIRKLTHVIAHFAVVPTALQIGADGTIDTSTQTVYPYGGSSTTYPTSFRSIASANGTGTFYISGGQYQCGPCYGGYLMVNSRGTALASQSYSAISDTTSPGYW